MMETKLQKRVHPRLKEYDYSTPGSYFITICTDKRKCILSSIFYTEKTDNISVGQGLAPAENVVVDLSNYGKVAEKYLLDLQDRFNNISIDSYAIMPNHIHFILSIFDTAGASPRPTVTDIVCAYKSLTTKKCKDFGLKGKLFQNSFYDHIIRNQQDYDECSIYIQNNPLKWSLDELFIE